MNEDKRATRECYNLRSSDGITIWCKKGHNLAYATGQPRYLKRTIDPANPNWIRCVAICKTCPDYDPDKQYEWED